MSKTAVIVALLVALGLGIAALVTWPRNGKAVEAGPLLGVEPATTTEVRVDFPDGSSQAVVRGEGGWRVVLKGIDRQERSWPAAQTQVHAALRIFSSLTPDQPADGSIDKPAGTLTIKGAGLWQVLKISGQRLGGRVLVEASGRAAWVDANIADMLITTGLKAWRDPAAFPGLADSASMVTISGQSGGKLTMARVQGKWWLREPFASEADPEVVSRLMARLGAVRITEFLDKAPPSNAGLDKPIATLQIETGTLADARRWDLWIGASADVAGRTVYGEVLNRGPGGGAGETVILQGEQLAAISADPFAYVTRKAVTGEPEDIGHVTLSLLGSEPCRRLEFRRTLDGWESRCGDAEWARAAKADAEGLAAMLTFLAGGVPEKVGARGAEDSAAATAAVKLATAGGTHISDLEVVVSGSQMIVRTEKVKRIYAAGIGKAAAEWLASR